MPEKNKLYYGDNLDVLRRYVKDETVDLVYLDPPFNSRQDYNVLFAEKDGTRSSSQIMAFEDTWEWNLEAERNYEEIVEGGGRISDAMRAFRTFLGSTDMMAYLAMMRACGALKFGREVQHESVSPVLVGRAVGPCGCHYGRRSVLAGWQLHRGTDGAGMHRIRRNNGSVLSTVLDIRGRGQPTCAADSAMIEEPMGTDRPEFDELALEARDALYQPGQRSARLLIRLRRLSKDERSAAILERLGAFEAAIREQRRQERRIQRAINSPNKNTYDRIIPDAERRVNVADETVRRLDREIWLLATGRDLPPRPVRTP